MHARFTSNGFSQKHDIIGLGMVSSSKYLTIDLTLQSLIWIHKAVCSITSTFSNDSYFQTPLHKGICSGLAHCMETNLHNQSHNVTKEQPAGKRQ